MRLATAPTLLYGRARFPRARRVLVTGADGFIGGHLARDLRAAGCEVTAVVFGRAARAGELRMDLTHDGEFARLPREIDAIVHAAGVVDGAADASRVFAVNVGATQSLLQWARAQRVSHFVQLSSVAVYGPLALGEDRTEDTPRLGRAVGLPYMRSKARAELLVETSGVPFTLLRPPAVIGPGDTVITPGFVQALRGAGLPLLPGAAQSHRVSVAFVEGLCALTRLVLARGPSDRAIHAVDAELTVLEIAELYARALRRPLHFAPLGWRHALQSRSDAGLSWLAASARFGQHYSSSRLRSELGYVTPLAAEDAVHAAVAALP